MGTETEVEEAVDVIVREKKISVRAHPRYAMQGWRALGTQPPFH